MTRPIPVANWHLLTGGYPPRPGGIADYTATIAAGLAASGDAVHVWTSTADGDTTPASGVEIHRIPSPWSRRGLDAIGRRLDALPEPRRIIVQFAPNEFECHGMNIRFCRWLRGRRRDDVRVMFHEVRYHPASGDGIARHVLVAVQTTMARILISASTRLYVSIPAWADLLRSLAGRRLPPIEWLPVPSNIPAVDDPAGVAAIRRRVAPRGEAVVGTFGTYGASTSAPLAAAFAGLLNGREERVGLLVGRNGESYAARLIAATPGLAGRVVATGGLDGDDVSRHLQACDLLIQPAHGGVCTKQGSTMAGLANGRAIVVGAGRLTEPIWSEEACVALASSSEAGDLVPIAGSLLDDDAARARLGAAARSAYDRRFSAGRTVDALRRSEAGP